MVNYSPVKILEYVRDGIVEQEHWGLIVKVSTEGNVCKIGDDKNYPFYLRSCAKPLQVSLIIDFGIDKAFNMTSEEIAVCCASHAGEDCHVQTVKGFLDKIGLDESYMKCGLHKPLSKTEQNKLIAQGRDENILQNNCSGKHAMMLAICKKKDWSTDDYDSPDHPLQIAIKKKIYELCELIPSPLEAVGKCNSELPPATSPLAGEVCFQFERVSAKIRKQGEGYPITKDGCGVPIYAVPLEKMVKGYLNLFFDEKYSKIREAFVQNPYLIGGEDRFDTAIMTASLHASRFTPHLIVKSGAGGICIVVNLEQKEGFVIKVMDSDMKARAICTIEALKQLGWLSAEMLKNDLIKAQNKTDILTLHGEKIGETIPCFKF